MSNAVLQEVRSLYWDDVEEGQALPTLHYELSLLRLVAHVRATGLYDYVHFDRDYARAVGARDAFIATPHVNGLFSRLMTDWAGPLAAVRSISLRMRTQSCAGDELVVTGRVGRKYVSAQGEHLVEIVDLNIGHAHAAQAATATAVLALPTRAGVLPRGERNPAPRVPAQLSPDLPDFVRQLVGTVKEGPAEPGRPLTADEIHLWCECLEDWNPLYWDEQAAAAGPYGGIVAPPAAMFHGADASAEVGVGCLKPGHPVPRGVQQGLKGIELLTSMRKDLLTHITPFSVPGYPEIAVSLAESEYFRPLRPGDHTHTTQEVLDCSPRKTTKLGEGHFLTWVRTVYNQRNEVVRTFTLTGLYYRPHAATV
ncbi:MaoC family dehydratase N-terminal domain-containing protein [Hydrogenophaga sp.]|uniref:MaoC family dehydratase n=1 Tax=Hydrogenophaga sp. TaxID=1904254 RepID=UPI00272195F2|nr:MaoC family dehydratase N-terminal domain-containing protein [Hydrogenophaga sp.]MDO9439056.1 MaoC family dehydratase N-terminal domain-containing protein [Hydrogenophaga sp.]